MGSVQNRPERKRRKSSLDLGSAVYGKVPPQDNDLESSILGALMLDSNMTPVAMGKLFETIFYKEAHQKVFKAIQQTYDANQKVDLFTIASKLKTNEDLEFIGGPYYLTELTKSVISSANIEEHIRIISESYMKREAIRLAGELIGEAYQDYSDPFDIIQQADAGFQAIQEKISAGNEKDIAFYGMKVLDQLSTTKEVGILGVSTGLQALDNVICGLVAPDLIILAARPGQGKTALALSITYYTSILRDEACAWFSLEMDGIQLVRRLASIDTGISHERIRRADTTEVEDKRLYKSIEKISTCKIYIEDKASINVRYIRSRAHMLKRKKGIKFIVVDYLQLMKGMNKKDTNREGEVAEISRSLKELAKELELPIIALSQLSREVEKRPNKMPQLSDLRESGGIEQDADEVIFLMRPEYYGMTDTVEMGGKEYQAKGLTVVKTDKNRHGDTKSTPLYFKGACMHFKDHNDYFDHFQSPGVNFKPVPKDFTEPKSAGNDARLYIQKGSKMSTDPFEDPPF